MPKLSATRTYADEQSPVQSDFDNFIDDIEVLVNTILLDDDNFQDGGIDGSLKLIDQSIEPNQIRNNNVTSEKINDNAVTTSKFLDQSVTTAKLADGAVTAAKVSPLAGKLPAGAVQMFHTFNGTVSYPRGWMLCNGDEINETNYNAIHGAGTYTTDGVSSSPILNKTLPDMDNRYAIGATATTKDGSSAIASVGNTDHLADFTHTHSTTHTHVENVNSSEFRPNSVSSSFSDEWWYAPNGASQVETDPETVTSGEGGSSALDVQPESLEVLYIMKVV